MFPHRNRRCGGGSRQAGLLGDQSEDLFERRVGGRRPGAVPGDSYGQGVEGLTVARFGRSSRKQVSIPSSVFGSIGPHGGSLSHTRCAGTGAAPQPSRRPSLELARRKNTTACAAVRLLSGVSPGNSHVVNEKRRPSRSKRSQSCGIFRGSGRPSGSRGGQPRKPAFFTRAAQSLAPSALRPDGCGKPRIFYHHWGCRSEPMATRCAEPKHPSVEPRPAGCFERGSRVLMASLRARMTSDPNAAAAPPLAPTSGMRSPPAFLAGRSTPSIFSFWCSCSILWRPNSTSARAQSSRR